jgi:outer membrane receptor protein involved in Fe transport
MNVKQKWTFLFKSLCLCGLLLVLAVAALAQRETGQISGTVRDPSGAVVAAAKVTVKSVATGVTRQATTNGVGAFTIPSLRPDAYDVTIEAPGFEKYAQRIDVAVGSTNEISPQLTLGATTSTVEVVETAAAVTVNTATQTLSQVITADQLADLPTSPTRNPYALVATSGNVVEDSNSGRGAGFAINGQRSASTSILLDGAENVDTFTASVGQTVPLDSVQEFSVLTNNFTAEYGRASGGVVNLITKSGTNAFHGSGYEFNRISALSSNTLNNNANDIAKGIFTRNNYGFAVGGPIKKDKLFFFNNTEWIRVRSSAPTELTIIDPGSYPKLAASSQSFFNAYGKLSPDVTTLNKVPCASLLCDVVSYNVPSNAGGGSPQNTWMEVAKVDYNWSDKTSISFRYAAYNENDFAGTVDNSPYAGYSTGETSFDQNAALTVTHVFAPTLVNTFKLVYNRLNGPVQPLGSAPVGPTLYTSGSVPSVGGYPLIFPGYNETTPGNSIPFGGPQNLYQIYDDISWTKGRHQFKFGGQFIQLRDNRTYGAYETAVEILGTNLSTGLANLTSGNIYQFEGAMYPQGKYPCVKNASTGAYIQTAACTVNLPVSEPAFERNYRYNDSALYVQDSWKATQRLTVNLGLRWEYYGVQHNANPDLDSNFVFGSGSTIFDQIRNGSVQLAGAGGVFGKPDYKNFAPRFGLAYDLFGDGTTAIRGGYSIGYERNFGNVTFNAIQNPPNYAVISLIAGSDIPSMPVYTDNAGPMGGTGSKALPAVSQRAINQNMGTAYAETWSMGIDRRITKNSVLALSYSGSHGVHLYDISNINPTSGGGLYLGDARASNRLNYQYSNMNYRSDGAYSHYNALNLKYSANNLWNTGLGVTMNYTWSHALDNLSSTFTETYGANSGLYYLGYLDAFNPRLNFGNADFDIRHRLVISENWDIPWLRTSSNPVLKYVVGGWGVGSILNIRSGMPFSIFDCNNVNDTSCPEYVANQQIPTSGSVVNTSSPNTFNYLALPSKNGAVLNQGDALGTPICKGLDHTGCSYSASGLAYPERNQYWGPGNWNLDMNFYKNFRVSERARLQVRAEMYNILNHNNQYVNGMNLDVSSMATPYVQTEKGGPWGYAGTSGDERRNIQFALRLSF